MKKLYLILVLMAAVVTVQAQSQLKTVRGKTRDGKNVVVQYYQGSIEDNIESVKYQVVDELQAKIKNLQNDAKTMQDKLNAANKQIQQLQKRLADQEGKDNSEALLEEITTKNKEIDSLNIQIANLNSEVIQLESDKAILVAELDSVKLVQKTQNPTQTTTPIQHPKTHVIGLEANVGLSVYGATVNQDWDSDFTLSKRLAVYYGSPRLPKTFPLSVEAGLGAHLFDMSAQKDGYEMTLEATDIDHQNYEGYYSYSDLGEKLTMTYLDIPIRICLGQPERNKVSVYAKIGVTPSILVNSQFTGMGTYSLKGYYPELDVTFVDIEELGFVSDANCYPEELSPSVSKFVLWGNVALGACIPFGSWPVQLNLGVKFDYPFMSLGSAAETTAFPNGMGLLQNNGTVMIPSATIGLIYTLK